jgi:hypothetical protein
VFDLPQYQLYIKNLLYGDFFVYYDNNKIKLNEGSYGKIYNIFVSDTYIPANLNSIIFLIYNNRNIDTITITLPCGMKNSNDNIELLNSIGGVSTFKSNYINIDIDNLNISDTNILNGLSQNIKDNVVNILPANSNIKNINFNNYK